MVSGGRRLLVSLCGLIGACQVDVDPASTLRGGQPGGAAGGASAATGVPAALADASLAGADLGRGELLSLACAACHHFRADQGTLVGPNLAQVFGRPAAALPDFPYSQGLKASGVVWTPGTLEAWLADPVRFVPGTTMGFTGYRSAEDRRDLLAYLLKITSQVP